MPTARGRAIVLVKLSKFSLPARPVHCDNNANVCYSIRTRILLVLAKSRKEKASTNPNWHGMAVASRCIVTVVKKCSVHIHKLDYYFYLL